ncbi:phospholipid scramblase 1-like isoform X2 [Formica exsecta]|uniref:phospholipid scramblase 1-like isoform X2 n=1 Tax=Formica exsecta TaxID=72781 RepID=UPI001141FE55|nr:phospholipid scramblase 1-like isoform X2 [Formica exsecta]XP_029675492.1 phospholipid scramblase 1-like isoform X2 [Formica exsecta]
MNEQKYPASNPPQPRVEMQPVVTAPLQPNAPVLSPGGWLPPSTIYPPGLQYLMELDYLSVNQKFELLEALTDTETINRYTVTNIRGEPIFYVVRKSNISWRLILSNDHSYEFNFFDRDRREVLHMIIRSVRIDSCCCPCYLPVLEVYSGNTLLGSVTEEWSVWRQKLYIRNTSGQPVLMIRPIIHFSLHVDFEVKSIDGQHLVGKIQHEQSGFFTISNMFGINFPRDLDVNIKAVLLGACFLIDFMYLKKRR